MTIIRKFPSPEELAHAAGSDFLSIAEEILTSSGRLSVVLAGGSTPGLTYQEIARQGQKRNLAWDRIHFFWGDERCVPPDHPDSNYRMALENLLGNLEIPAENIHRMEGEIQPRAAAVKYKRTLEEFFGDGPASFDVVFLGMGADGHTASLFPGSQAVFEQTNWVTAYRVETLKAWRITLTPAILNQAKNIHFLVTGREKAAALRRVLSGRFQPEILPAQAIQPSRDNLRWYIDQQAGEPG